MAKIKLRNIEIPPSPSPDVAGYFLYWCPAGESLSYNSDKIDLGSNLSLVIPDDAPALAGLDGEYRMAVTAYDEVGNESDMSQEALVPFDFVAPEAPSGAPVVS